MTVWLVQYRYETDRAFEMNLKPGTLQVWRINPFKAATITREAQDSDLVVIWRTKDDVEPAHREQDDGGIIGWGRVALKGRLPEDEEIPFVVTHAFPDRPTPRQDVIAALSQEVDVANFWPGQVALKRLNDQEATVIEGFRPGNPPPEPMWHPLASGYPPDWASGWGQDECGVFVEFTVGEVTQRMRWCPPGEFLMGSPESEKERRSNEGPQSLISFSEGFWLFDTPVTNALYRAVSGETETEPVDATQPVTKVSWLDAVKFLKRLDALIPGLDLRLPSEAEWEYACRAGSNTPFEPNVARRLNGQSITPEEVNYDGNYPYGDSAKGLYREKTIPVDNFGFRPNKWGLRQMHGNVFEWCADLWNESHEGAKPDGSPRQASQQDGGSARVLRGGSWNDYARYCRSACRSRDAPGARDDVIGFRPARGQ